MQSNPRCWSLLVFSVPAKTGRASEKAWDAVLKETGIQYFKSSEYNHLTGQFAKYLLSAYPEPTGRGAAKEIKCALQKVVADHPRIRGVGIFVLVDDFEKVRSRPEVNGLLGSNPYHRALEA